MPSKYGFGNTRKKSPYRMGGAHYGMDQKNPVAPLKQTEEGVKTAATLAAVGEKRKPRL